MVNRLVVGAFGKYGRNWLTNINIDTIYEKNEIFCWLLMVFTIEIITQDNNKEFRNQKKKIPTPNQQRPAPSLPTAAATHRHQISEPTLLFPLTLL